jgi:hypothetical protein
VRDVLGLKAIDGDHQHRRRVQRSCRDKQENDKKTRKNKE